ncbi:unnamed protein product (macronuclear) [Paramecium tetraurelia]|uniref:Uncharacterized protein n=1 Tax=Paramecium tetraurelia TaxID=5888 RepID=A0E523_PARTE|nr:uncharacterized protein GSPATT00023567001 [Paramecium tetraurelia]CAK90390.1 unnamed protein product [Paramecium tetraurelia]|eukprot:XP_001457787.1 hypothetical protein (macronuclear) [Paramecium tetraurelia strain d4-2]
MRQIKDQNSLSPIFLQKLTKTSEKFYKALARLQEAQYKEQNSVNPRYPFVFQFSFNEIIVNFKYIEQVHLGRHQVQLSQPQDSYSYQFKKIKQIQKKPTLPQKYSVQKRIAFSVQDQKDSKNIPKNYCKAIITFAQKNQQLCLQILGDELKVARFTDFLSNQKKKLLNIRVFSALLQQCDDPFQEEFNRTFRIISQIFIKKYAINYIYNSKIVQHNWHIRYRQQIYKGIKNPKSFSHLKKL